MSYDLSRPDYKIMNVNNPTREQLLEWAFDDDLYLTEQDEDLMLYRADLLPVMLEIANTNNCPKKDYVFNILCEYTREAAIWSKDKKLLKQIVELTSTQVWANPEILTLRDFAKRLLTYLESRHPVDEAGLDQQAVDLLVGMWGNIEHLEYLSTAKPNHVRYGVKRGSTYHAVEIDLRSGEFYPERVWP